MNLFIHFDEQGQVISVAKVHVTHGAAQNPFQHVERQEMVLELNATEEFRPLDAHEIAEQYVVDVKSKTLLKLKPASAAKLGEEPKQRPVKNPRPRSDRK